MAFVVRPLYCTASSYGVPALDTKHPLVERIKSEALHPDQAARQPRSVTIVYRPAKSKSLLPFKFRNGLYKCTGPWYTSLLHWAIRIDSTYFELDREDHDVKFIHSSWSDKTIKQISGDPV